ncbi:MAG TPA: hypothetical protein VNQ32_10895 [Steroidobacteraceae bacterium]|nr:hypothetical protein [Steroidobacteraceae bacterium]
MKMANVLFAAATLTFSPGGFSQMGGEADLRAMEAELTKLREIYSDQHPDVVRLLRRIEAHKSAPGVDPSEASNGQSLSELQSARARLAELRRRHGNDHPEVEKQIKLVKEIEQREGN